MTTRCQPWSEHEFKPPHFVEAGRDVMRGRYQRFVRRCQRCGRELSETHWLDLPISDRPDQGTRAGRQLKGYDNDE